MKLLILGDEEKAVYHPLGRISGGLMEALKDTGECEVMTEYRFVPPEKLKEYDAIISYIDNYQGLEGFDNILADYIEEGGRVLALHNGIITSENSRLERAYGGNFIQHPPYRELQYYLGEELTAVMGEEPYMVKQTDENNEVFLWFEMEGERYPAGWYRNAGKGKVCYLAPGHDERTVRREEFQELLRRAVEMLVKKA